MAGSLFAPFYYCYSMLSKNLPADSVHSITGRYNIIILFRFYLMILFDEDFQHRTNSCKFSNRYLYSLWTHLNLTGNYFNKHFLMNIYMYTVFRCEALL